MTTAQMAREMFDTHWIKLEVIGDDDTLQPDVFGLVEAAARRCARTASRSSPTPPRIWSRPSACSRPAAEVLMPWGAPIGSGRGLDNRYALKALRAHFPDVPLIVDAGIGAPSHAAQAMELGFDAVLLNTAVAEAADPGAHGRAPSPRRSRPAAWPSRPG